jgi:hypothetical protein
VTFRTVSVDMWRKDDWFADLAPDAKLVWIYSFTNDSTSPAGIYRIALRTIANDTGIALERVKEIIAEFSTAGKLYYENGIIWPVTMRKHQIGELKSTDNLVKKIVKDLADLPDCPIVRRYEDHYRLSIAYPEGTAAEPKPLASPLQAPLEGDTEPLRDTRHLTQDTGHKTQNTERDSKRAAGKPHPHDPNLDHPAVIAYRDICHLTANQVQRQSIATTVTDPERWKSVLKEWMEHGWKPTNVTGMLERYGSSNGNTPYANEVY